MLSRAHSSRDHCSILKYVIVGDAAVGKSCLLVRLTDDKFANAEPTLGVEFGSKILTVGDEGKRVKVQCECHPGVQQRGHCCGRPPSQPSSTAALLGLGRREARMRAVEEKAARGESIADSRLGHGRHRVVPLHHALVLPRRGGRPARVRRDTARE